MNTPASPRRTRENGPVCAAISSSGTRGSGDRESIESSSEEEEPEPDSESDIPFGPSELQPRVFIRDVSENHIRIL